MSAQLIKPNYFVRLFVCLFFFFFFFFEIEIKKKKEGT